MRFSPGTHVQFHCSREQHHGRPQQRQHRAAPPSAAPPPKRSPAPTPDAHTTHTHRLAPSRETNCPTAEEPPPLFSTNCTSETMMLSSSTEPHPVQTASPRAESTSMSEPPQAAHTRPPDILTGRQAGATSPQRAEPLASLSNAGWFLALFLLHAGLAQPPIRCRRRRSHNPQNTAFSREACRPLRASTFRGSLSLFASWVLGDSPKASRLPDVAIHKSLCRYYLLISL